MDYFELYGFEPAPTVDQAQLNKKYRELQRQYHPDFYSQANEADQEEALEKSAAVNNAYKIFTNKEKTIAYFLTLNKELEENEKYELPPGFLMEMMELNEAVMEEEEQVITQKISLVNHELDEDVEPALQKQNGFTAADMASLKSYYYRKKYLQRILDRLGD